MAQSTKDRRAASRRAAKLRVWHPVNEARRIGQVNPLAAAEDTDRACRWPLDIYELGQRITKEGERAVPNHDRDLVGDYLPAGCLTRRDGTSVRPQFRELANV